MAIGFYAINPAIPAVTITLANNGASLPLVVSVSGSTVTVQLATDPASVVLSLESDVVNAMNLYPPSAALLASVTGTPGAVASTGSVTTTGGGTVVNGCNSALVIYDENRQTIQSLPILDVFLNELATTSAGLPYLHNGALVPPLHYQQNSAIRVDIQSLSNVPLRVILNFIGRQRFPC